MSFNLSSCPRPDMPSVKAFVHQYLNGSCDALAIALASYADSGVRSMHPVHVKKNGERVVGQDCLHAYAIVDDHPWDCRGKRSEEDVLADFARFLEVLRKDDDVRMEVEYRNYESAQSFVEESGCNPGGAPLALTDAVAPLGLDPAIVRMTARSLEAMVAELEDPKSSLDAFCM